MMGIGGLFQSAELRRLVSLNENVVESLLRVAEGNAENNRKVSSTSRFDARTERAPRGPRQRFVTGGCPD